MLDELVGGIVWVRGGTDQSKESDIRRIVVNKPDSDDLLHRMIG